MSRALAGAPSLLRLALRRDRLRLAIWVVAISVLVSFTAASVVDLYEDEVALAQYAATVDSNAALVAVNGPATGLETFGGRVAWESWPLVVAVAVMAVLTVSRHARAEEEAGRTELLRSAQVGRHAHSAAAFLVAAGASLAVGVGATLALLPFDLPASGAATLGAAFAATGMVFAGVALVTAQVSTHSRAATGGALAVVGVAFVLRAVGDVGAGTLSWASPFGWMQATEPYVTDRWWPVLLSLAVAVLLVAAAVALERVRDVGGGLVADRAGPPVAAARLGTPIGLAWRLQRGTLAAWTAGLLLGGVAFGSIAESADDLVGDNEAILDYLADLGDASLSEIFLGTLLVYLGLLAAAYAVGATNRLRSEETANRAEAVLATATSRERWAASHVVVAAAGSAFALLVAGAAMGTAYGISTGEPGQVVQLALAALAYVPAVWLLAAVAFALFGLAPRLGVVVWAYLGVCVVLDLLGEGLGIPSSVQNLSPFRHVGQVPAAAPSVVGLLVLLALCALLVAVGRAGFARRDLTTQ